MDMLQRHNPAAYCLVGLFIFGVEAVVAQSVVPQAGTFERAQLIKSSSVRPGHEISAKLMDPIYVGEKIALPAGTSLQGDIGDLSANRTGRLRGRLNGDFTPFHKSHVRSTSVVLPSAQAFGPIMCICANAQSSALNHQRTLMAEAPSPASQYQDASILDRTPVPRVPLAGELPDAPSLQIQANRTGAQQSPASVPGSVSGPAHDLNGGAGHGQQDQIEGTAQITGVVSDAEANGVTGAEVVLTSPGKMGHERKTTAANDGTFRFTNLPAGKFRLVVAAPGFGTYNSSELSVMSGETIQAPKITLNIAASSSVNVYATADQIAEAQVEEQEKQRVFGVFQNFYTSYIWDAEPMSAKQKYRLAFRTIIDPTTFVVIAGVAGAEQYNGTYPGYGPGIEGYGKRYGAALADSVSGRIIGSAVLASAFHQDPRYFYQGSGGIRSRAWHALSSAVMTRSDNGKLRPNYSHLLGNLAAGGIAHAYHPESSRGLGLTFQTLGITTGANAIGNLFREFVLRSLEPSVPGFANGKKGSTSTPSHR